MLFHTWNFLLFFVITYFVYLCLRRTRYHLHWLLICSYFFYGWWNPLYLLLIAYSTALDFFVVNRMENSSHKKRWLVASIVNNLLLLGFFKYGGFVTDNLNGFLSAVHAPFGIPDPGILLPVGISFYTFQSMSYTIDFYRGTITRERSFVRFAAFVALFPQSVAGPIAMADQRSVRRTWRTAHHFSSWDCSRKLLSPITWRYMSTLSMPCLITPTACRWH